MDLPSIGTYTYGDKAFDVRPATLRQVRAFRAAEDPEEGILALAVEVTGARREDLEDLPPGVVRGIALAALDTEGNAGNFTPAPSATAT